MSLKKINKSKFCRLMEILQLLAEIVRDNNSLNRALLAYKGILEYMPAAVIAKECYKPYQDKDAEMSKRLRKLPEAILNKYSMELPAPPKHLTQYQKDPEQYFNDLKNDDLKKVLKIVKDRHRNLREKTRAGIEGDTQECEPKK